MQKVKTLKTIIENKNLEKGTLSEITMLLNAFHGRQDHTFTKTYIFNNQITTKCSHQQRTDSERCGALNAIMVIDVKDASVPLINCSRYAENKLMLYQDLAARKTRFHSY